MNKGQSLFEVVVAIAISALIITTVVSLASNSIRNATFSKNKARAATYVQEANEWLRGQRDNDINVFEANALIPTWCISDLSWNTAAPCDDSDIIPGAPFWRQLVFTIDNSSGKTIVAATISVYWDDSQGRHDVTSATNFSDWRQR